MAEKLYAVPQGWEWKKLGDIAFIKGGKRVPKGKKLTEQKTEHPYIRVSDFTDNGTIDTSKIQYVTEDIYTEIKNYTITCKDLYISIAGTIGKTGIIPKELDGANLTENAVKLVYKIQEIDNKFVYLFTLSNFFKEQAGLATKVVAMPKLAISRLSEIKIPLPSLEEQRRIVKKLDGFFAKIDKSIALLDVNIASANALMPSALNEVFEELGEKWEKKKLGEIASIGTGVTPLKSKLEYYANGSINWITSKATNDDYVLEAEQAISEIAVQECRLKIYPKGTLIIALYGQGKTRGQVSELSIDTTINQAIAAVNIHDGNLTQYIKYFLKKSYFELRKKASGGTQENLNLSIIKSIEIPLPPFNIQTQTVAYLDALHVKTEALKKAQVIKKAKLLALKASLLESAFKGEL